MKSIGATIDKSVKSFVARSGTPREGRAWRSRPPSGARLARPPGRVRSPRALDVGQGSCCGYALSMDVIRLDTTIDEALARALPALRPLLGRHVELVAAEMPAVRPSRSKLTVDDLLASRIDLPSGVGPISLEDMDRAIMEGALGR